VLVEIIRWLIGLSLLALVPFSAHSSHFYIKIFFLFFFAVILIPPFDSILKKRLKVSLYDYIVTAIMIIWGIYYLIKSFVLKVLFNTFMSVYVIWKYFSSGKLKVESGE